MKRKNADGNDKQWMRLLARAEAAHADLARRAKERGIDARAYDFSKVQAVDARARCLMLVNAAESLQKRIDTAPRRKRY